MCVHSGLLLSCKKKHCSGHNGEASTRSQEALRKRRFRSYRAFGVHSGSRVDVVFAVFDSGLVFDLPAGVLNVLFKLRDIDHKPLVGSHILEEDVNLFVYILCVNHVHLGNDALLGRKLHHVFSLFDASDTASRENPALSDEVERLHRRRKGWNPHQAQNTVGHKHPEVGRGIVVSRNCVNDKVKAVHNGGSALRVGRDDEFRGTHLHGLLLFANRSTDNYHLKPHSFAPLESHMAQSTKANNSDSKLALDLGVKVFADLSIVDHRAVGRDPGTEQGSSRLGRDLAGNANHIVLVARYIGAVSAVEELSELRILDFDVLGILKAAVV
mmetsp:Transcript_7636/g.11830  ORF Transcript_7636/g.11830 Transcript_7636/m.11830 type:complete len:327 (+) Transcript_7636:163-1143(+)